MFRRASSDSWWRKTSHRVKNAILDPNKVALLGVMEKLIEHVTEGSLQCNEHHCFRAYLPR